jgi:hypothetical protein
VVEAQTRDPDPHADPDLYRDRDADSDPGADAGPDAGTRAFCDAGSDACSDPDVHPAPRPRRRSRGGPCASRSSPRGPTASPSRRPTPSPGSRGCAGPRRRPCPACRRGRSGSSRASWRCRRAPTVTFPNYDKIFHNVFSLSEAAAFDLGLYRNGASRTTRFEKPGVVRVYCNIHPQMAAFIVVLDGRLYSQTGKDGVALIPAVPAGRQTLKVWDERGGEWTGTVVVPAGGTAEVPVPFDVSKWKLAPHKNKHGKNYPPPDDDANRY